MSTSHDGTTLYRAYIALWNATTQDEQRRRRAEALTEDAHLVYPVFTCRGIEAHHGWLRVGWRMVRDDGSIVMAGEDVATVAEEGRLRHVIGFHDPLPPLE